MSIDRRALDELVSARLGQPLSRVAIERLQLSLLRECYGISSFEELRAKPFTFPADIAANPGDFLRVSRREVERVVTLRTSGTSGKPKRLFFSAEDLELTVDFFHHGMNTLAGARDTVMICFPCDPPDGLGDLLARGLSRIPCACVRSGEITDCRDALLALTQNRVTCIVGPPKPVLELARRSALSGAGIQLSTALLSSDYVPPAARELVRSAWGAELYEHYGMTETGYGGAVECALHDGYHIREADLLFEVVEPLSGQPLPPGEYGELTVTTLTRRAMPLLRYRTGDLSRLLPEPCRCGSPLLRLAKIGERW
jgi:phenylacetate-coenzyme A ligase PaaK-like adenylate-forming protein